MHTFILLYWYYPLSLCGNTYKANVLSKAYLHLKLYYNLEQLRRSGFIESLEKQYDYPVIVLFGSYAKAMDDEQSDIDLCIISQAKPTFDITSYEKRFGRRISIHLFDKQRWQQKKRKNPELINSVCNGIVLSGQRGAEGNSSLSS